MCKKLFDEICKKLLDSHKCLTVPRLSNNLRDYNLSRGIMKTGVHRWRHTFAKKWILAGGDIFRLQKILGHSSLDVVKEYVDMFTRIFR